MNRQQALKLLPAVNNPQVWEALKGWLMMERDRLLVRLVGETSPQEFPKIQAQINFLDKQLALPDIVQAALDEEEYGT